MPRQARFAFDNGIYHVMMRGNNQQIVFHEDEDFLCYKRLLAENRFKFGLEIYHYVLMNNHIHLILKAPTGKNLSDAIKRLNLTYTLFYRKKYKGIGHFFQDRFKSFIIQEGRYLLECGRYVELNPFRAGLVEKPEDYGWSSLKSYITWEKESIIDFDPEYIGLSDDSSVRMHSYKEFIANGMNEKRSERRFFKDGAYGSKEFIENLKQKGLRPEWSHRGQPRKDKNKRADSKTGDLDFS